jgi:hypothetical protein
VSVVVTNPTAQSGTLNPGFFYAAAPAATDYYTATPCRIIDTRTANALSANQTQTFTLTAGSCGIPVGAKSVAVNATVIDPPAAGYFEIFPGNAFPLGTSTLNFTAGITRANNATLTLATDGTGTIGVLNASAGAVDFVLDVVGYYL